MNEEVRMILEMLKSGKISTDDAEKLLEKVQYEESHTKSLSTKSDNRKFLKILVVEGDATKVNINVPLALAEVALQLVPKEKLKLEGINLDLDNIYKLIDEQTEGELVHVDTINEQGKEVKVNISIN